MDDSSVIAGHAFISYVREDSRRVDRLQNMLQSAGIPVWRDTADLWPGEDWRSKIRQAITGDALVFIACFSRSSVARRRSYQNEELALAIEQMRLRRPNEPWLIPVRFDECEISDLFIGGARTLASIQRVDLFGRRYQNEAGRLVTSVLRILGRKSDATIQPNETQQSSVGTPSRRRMSKERPQASESPKKGIWRFPDSRPLTIVCGKLPSDMTGPQGDPAHPNYAELGSFVDVDALVELHGHIRAENPTMTIHIKAASEVDADELVSHLVLLGGFALNYDVPLSLPVQQIEDPTIPTGEIFIAEVDGSTVRFLSKWSENPYMLLEDVGLLCRMANPFNLDRTVTICNGIHTRGVLGAVRSFTDARLRELNTRYIEQTFQNDQQFGILMRIMVIQGKAMTPDFTVPGTVLYQWP